MTLTHQLNTLESSGLIRLAQAQPELEYLFRHALVQDAAYASLVKHDRRRLHQAVGEAIERMFPERIRDGELAPLLARHFDEAGDDDRALQYFTLAGDGAARVYANAEAIMHYARALDIARRIPLATSGAEVLTHLYAGLGRALELNAQYAAALANYGDMETVARDRGDRMMELAALMARAKIYATPNPEQNPSQARTLLEKALSLARALSDRATECKILWNLMAVLLWSGGDQHQAVGYGEASLALARELDLREQLAFDLNDLAYAYMSVGRWSHAQAALDESRDLWRELGDLPMLADNLANSVLIHLRAGHYRQAMAASDEALRISRSIGNVWGQAGSQAYVGLVYLERGEPDRAVAVMEEAVRLAEQVGHPAPIVATRADLGWTYGTLGAIRRGIELTQLALSRATRVHYLRVYPIAVQARLHLLEGDLAAAEAALRTGYRELKPEGLQWFAPILIPLADAELALARQDPARAIALMDDLLDNLRGSQTRFLTPDALYLKGQALLAIGSSRVEEAGRTLMQARAEAEALGSRRMLWPILVALSEVADRRGNPAEAQALRRQAREIVEYIADHAGTPELRDSFLGLPHVRAVVADG